MEDFFSATGALRGNQGKWILNGAFYKADEYGYEAAAEYLTTEILRQSNMTDYAPYVIVPHGYSQAGIAKNCCMSPDFLALNPGCRELTLYEFLQSHLSEEQLEGLMEPHSKFHARHSLAETIAPVVELVESKTGLSDFGGYITAIMELDALTRNDDRHINNISLLQLPNGLWKTAPVFDNASGFGARDKDPTIGSVHGITVPWLFNEARYYKVGARPFSSSFEKQVKACRQLYGSRLQIKEDIDLTEAFARITETYGKAIAERMESVWNISKAKYSDLFVPRVTKRAYANDSVLTPSEEWAREHFNEIMMMQRDFL